MKKPIKDYLLVTIQIILFGLYVLDYEVISFTLPIFVNSIGSLLLFLGVIIGLIAVIQLNSSLSPFPTPIKKGSLVQSGVFSLVRHPIYFALICCSFGYGISENSEYKILLSILLLILFNYKSKYEENLLIEKYVEYKTYMSNTGRLFPIVFR